MGHVVWVLHVGTQLFSSPVLDHGGKDRKHNCLGSEEDCTPSRGTAGELRAERPWYGIWTSLESGP
eukprot:3811860-Amphidinium_carterae.2